MAHFKEDRILMDTVQDIQAAVRRLADPEKAKILQRFFKTGPGQYGEGDVFAGIMVPMIRKLVRKYHDIPLGDAGELLQSPVHEERLLALFILVEKCRQGDDATRKRIYNLYRKNTRFINNWDLVDLSAERIVGAYLDGTDHAPLYRLARSKSLWERRIAILATFYDIKRGIPDHTLALADVLLADRHDLIHKAVGWMLREVGKRCNPDTLREFLRTRYRNMPRTMLRYAIERFPADERAAYLAGTMENDCTRISRSLLRGKRA
jgi:3-methyladenine DNA glycosylase AlkD